MTTVAEKKLLPLFTPQYGTKEDVFNRSLNLGMSTDSTYKGLEKALEQTVAEKRDLILNKISYWKAYVGIKPNVEKQLKLIANDEALLAKLVFYYDGSFMNTGLRVRQHVISFGHIEYATQKRLNEMANYDHYDMDLLHMLHDLGEAEVERINKLPIYEQMKYFADMYEGFFVQLVTETNYDYGHETLCENKVKKHKREVYLNNFDQKAGKRLCELQNSDKDVRYALRMSEEKKHMVLAQYRRQNKSDNDFHFVNTDIVKLMGNDLFMSKLVFTDHSEYDFCIEALLKGGDLWYILNLNKNGLQKYVDLIHKETGYSKEMLLEDMKNGREEQLLTLVIEYLDYIPLNIGYKPVSKS